MQYEEFDKKIRDAADHHHPAYDEQAWGKMENMLNTHMPQEKEDRRRFIFFLLFILLSGGAVLLITKPWGKENSVVLKEQVAKESIVKREQQSNTRQEKNIDPAVNIGDDLPPNDIVSPQDNLSLHDDVVSQNGRPEAGATTKSNNGTRKNSQIKNSKPKNITHSEFNALFSLLKKKSSRKKNISETTAVNSSTPVEKDNHQPSPVPEKKEEIFVNQNNTVNNKDKTFDAPVAIDSKGTTSPAAVPVAKETEVVKQKEAKKEKSKSPKSNSFFFSISAGPDVSAAGGEKPGKAKLLTGLGLGYTFKDRLTVRTGFYTGRKIYEASSNAYNPPAVFWNYYPYLEKVEANCRVFEIPVSVSYSFGKSVQYNWFAAVGVSSYLMKEETYDYYYKYTPYSSTSHSKWTISNENKHLFSVVTLSGGYQRKINKNVSLMLEPYIKLPLSGVGYGKVKLNSGGVLMTLTVKPFQGGKKEK